MFKQTKAKTHKRLLSPLLSPPQVVRLARQFTGLVDQEMRGTNTVTFGKYKNCEHKKLITGLPYCRWILSTEYGFATKTKTYITDYFIENDISLTKKRKIQAKEYPIVIELFEREVIH